MIRVTNLRYAYPPNQPGEAWQAALDDLSFEVPAGTCLAVTGPNNSGKTTLCLALAGLAPRLTVGDVTGQIVVNGRDVQAEPPGALADAIGLVLQEPLGQLFNPTVEAEIAWGLENLGLDPAEMPARIDHALSLVGLADIRRSQPPQTLSGGQQKRLALAAALALRPQVLLLDDPSGGLSPLGRGEVLETLRTLRERESLTILFTENDPEVIAALADEVMVLDRGHIIARGAPHTVFLSGADALPGVALPPAGRFSLAVNRARGFDFACLTAGEAVAQAKAYRLNGHISPAGDETLLTPPETDPPAVQLENLSFAYEPDLPVFEALDLRIEAGQFVALTGDNGAGKTTLLKHLIGLLRPVEGRVCLFGEDTAGRSAAEMARLVGFAFQNPELQIFNATIKDEVSFGPRNLGAEAEAVDKAVSDALNRFGLADLRDYPPAAMSFSTRRLVALASIAAMSTPIIVLDEPTVGLDAAGQAQVMAWLSDRHREGATVVLATHNMELAARYAQRVLVMEAGNFAADGPPEAVFHDGDVLACAGLEPPFAHQFAAGLSEPSLASYLTPERVAAAWAGRVK